MILHSTSSIYCRVELLFVKLFAKCFKRKLMRVHFSLHLHDVNSDSGYNAISWELMSIGSTGNGRARNYAPIVYSIVTMIVYVVHVY